MFKQRLSRFVVMCATACVLAGCVSENPQFTEFKPESKSEKRKNNARIKTELAIQYTQNRDYRSAVQAIDGAIQDDPSFEIAWLIRAQVYQHLKVYDKAEENFRHALSMKPDSAEINNNYGWFLCDAMKRPNDAMVYFDKALADPTYPSPEIANMNKGICSARAGQISMAETYFERALQLNPDFVPVFKERARAHLQQHKNAVADKEFRRYQSRVDILSADDLLLGWKIAKANNEMQAASEYEAQLRMNYPYSPELEAVGGKGDDE